MKAALYDSHLRTLGGGEQHALAIARWLLARGHPVDVLARPGITLEECEERLGVTLSGARLVDVDDNPLAAEAEATERSAGYDLFVNATFGSGAPSRARRSALLVYFPYPPGPLPELPARERDRWVADARRRPLGWIENDHGLHAPEPGGAWSDGRASYRLRLSKAGQASVRVTLASPRPAAVPTAAATFTLDDVALLTRPLPRAGTVTVEVPLPAASTRGHLHRFDIRTDRFNLAAAGAGEDGRDLGAFITKVELTCGNHPDAQVEYGWRMAGLDTYDVVLANSRYTAGWIRRLWGQDAPVLYPPVVPSAGRAPDDRAPTIVALGRFFEGSHSKKQLEMVRAFAALCDAGLEGWTLHLLGGVGRDGEDYLETVRAASQGYPVAVTANAPRGEVAARLGEASLFWQATGWGEDPETHPDRFEHFGIALVEAMGAGAVPVVIDAGAAREVVRHKRDGMLWRSEHGPGTATAELAHRPTRRARLSRSAVRRSAHFSPTMFDRRVSRLLGPLLA